MKKRLLVTVLGTAILVGIAAFPKLTLVARAAGEIFYNKVFTTQNTYNINETINSTESLKSKGSIVIDVDSDGINEIELFSSDIVNQANNLNTLNTNTKAAYTEALEGHKVEGEKNADVISAINSLGYSEAVSAQAGNGFATIAAEEALSQKALDNLGY